MTSAANHALQRETGSFRDREARVFYRDGKVYRCLSERALQAWERLEGSHLWARENTLGAGRTVGTHRVPAADGVPCPEGSWDVVLEHDRVPVITYPYEWCFGMLKDAALLTLDLMLAGLDEDMMLKDATPYNVQWQGSQPVFIDVASFDLLEPGEPWPGYRQFCELFLYPLMLCAYKNVPFHPFMRGRLEGVEMETLRQLVGIWDWLRPGVLVDVVLHAHLQRAGERSTGSARRELREGGFNRDMIRANGRRLEKVVSGMRWGPSRSTWSSYARDAIYGADGLEAKREFICRVAGERKRSLAWDVGANDGTFSRIVATSTATVLAMDYDHAVVERLYQALKAESNRQIIPLVMNVADPSPALGWRGGERGTLLERGRPDLTLCLALLHHLVIGANVPLAEVVEWMAELRSELIVEFVTRQDPQVQILLRNKTDHYQDYDQDSFEKLMEKTFEVVTREEIVEGRRFLYLARPRN